LKAMIERHADATGSTRALEVLASWDEAVPKFVKVLPKDYKRVLMAMDRVIASGLSGDEAVMAAFEENARDLARVGGN
jgi:glutamate synthase (ferredoxin)